MRGGSERPDSGHCPAVSELSAFSRGALPLPALHLISQHVSVCSACDSKVSTFVNEMEHGLTAGDGPAAASAPEATAGSGSLDLREARIDSSGNASPIEGEAPTAPLRLGQYRLIRQLGRGGMGVVYQARHERLLRDVAIKFVPVESIKDLLDVGRLQREMAAVGTMRHPNVVYATDAGEAEGIHYLVMEYVDGVDLSKLVLRVGPLDMADACEIIRQAALGLAHVEQQKLVHRDLKPSNLMLAADGTVKILDLGLARVRSEIVDGSELTRDGYLLGTIDYVAPEQARDAHSADIRSDIYSLGCTFYKLLTGGPPFGGPGQQSVASKILAHQQKPPPPLADHRADIPAEIEQVVRRMLAKDPAERFQSPVEVDRALAPLAAGADLPALLGRARKAPAVPNPGLLSSPKPSTKCQPPPNNRSTIASLRTSRSRTAAGVGGGILVCLAIGLLWIGGGLSGLIGSTGSSADRIPSPTVNDILAAKDSGQIDYPFPEFHAGILGKVTSPAPGALKLESEYVQLVRLGFLRDDAERVSFSIDQSPLWNGQVGVFFGYHAEHTTVRDSRDNELSGPVAGFQLLLLHRHPGDTQRESYLVVQRIRASIHPTWTPGNPFLYSDPYVESDVRIPLPKNGKLLPVELEFSGRGTRRQLKRIVINEVEVKDLADPLENVVFSPREYEGTLGLFNYGNIGGAVFRNFDLSNLEKE